VPFAVCRSPIPVVLCVLCPSTSLRAALVRPRGSRRGVGSRGRVPRRDPHSAALGAGLRFGRGDTRRRPLAPPQSPSPPVTQSPALKHRIFVKCEIFPAPPQAPRPCSVILQGRHSGTQALAVQCCFFVKCEIFPAQNDLCASAGSYAHKGMHMTWMRKAPNGRKKPSKRAKNATKNCKKLQNPRLPILPIAPLPPKNHPGRQRQGLWVPKNRPKIPPKTRAKNLSTIAGRHK